MHILIIQKYFLKCMKLARSFNGFKIYFKSSIKLKIKNLISENHMRDREKLFIYINSNS